jgi:hypothetical protein
MAPSGGSGLPRMDLKPTSAKMLKTVTPLRIAGALVDLFTKVGQRSPPSQTKTEHVRLISIAVSNYVEKARWGLDLLETNPKSPIYYTEDLHPPAFAAFQTVAMSKDQASQSPMVILPPTGRAVWGSDVILRGLCNDPNTVDLYPKGIATEIKALEDDLAVRLGATTRCFGYSILLDRSKQHYGVASKFLTLHCPTVEQKLFDRMLDRGLAKGMIRAMNVTDYAEAAEQEIRRVFDEMSQRLEADGRDYLMDTPSQKYGFTAADLTLGALSYFVIRPPEMGLFHLTDEETPPGLIQLGKELRETTAGKHVLKMYKLHRPVDTQTGEISLKKVDQNRTPWKEFVGVVAALSAVAVGIASSFKS